MPLTSVVDYFNHRLPELHPHAQLRAQAFYHLRQGLLTAEVAGFVVRPYLVPVSFAGTGRLFAYRARLLVRTRDGHPAAPESLYVQAWDAADVLFLDRFLRTLQALNHLHQGHDPREALVLDVHLRHLAALPEHHGEVFEGLLHRLGLNPGAVILRLDGRALHSDAHVQGAARSFDARGYRLVAVQPPPTQTDWDLLGALGVRWVSLSSGAFTERLARGGPRPGRNPPLGWWVERVDSAGERARVCGLGAELIEGRAVSGAIRQLPTRQAARRAGSPVGAMV